jgi:hypothetical protein
MELFASSFALVAPLREIPVEIESAPYETFGSRKDAKGEKKSRKGNHSSRVPRSRRFEKVAGTSIPQLR